MSIPEATRPAAGSEREPVPLTLQQEFLCAMDRGDEEGAFGHRHTIASGWRLGGAVDVPTLRRALDEVVRRHEMLHTTISRGEGERTQWAEPVSPVRLVVRDLPADDPATADRAAEEFFNEVEEDAYPVRELPHLRAALGRLGDGDAVLVLVVHHVACDGWSMRVISRDLAAIYASLRGLPGTEPPEARQYREYVAWQRDGLGDDSVTRAREYWRAKLDGAAIAAVPADRPRSSGLSPAYSTHRFPIGADVTSDVLKLAKAMRCSPFMVLVAVYNLVMHRAAGVDDVVVATFTSGRGHESFHDTVGAFLNFLPLRTDVAACATFADLLESTRATCIEAYTHDIPFPLIDEEAPELMAPFAEDGLDVIAFEVLQFPESLEGRVVGDVRYSEIRRRLLSQPASSDIPDGALWALDILPSGEIIGSLKFNGSLFDAGTMWRMIEDYDRILRNAVSAPGSPLKDL